MYIILYSNPLTASIDIQKTAPTFKQFTKVTGETLFENKLGEFADDILNISALGHEKQHKQVQAS